MERKRKMYTIGHGSREPEEFLAILKNLDIQYLIDVRSQPYSKFNPKFNQLPLKGFLKRHGIEYVFMGDLIGGRPPDISCYDSEGKVDYDVIRTKDFFLRGIDRLKIAYQKNLSVVIMCSESNPLDCHRTKLIGPMLNKEMIALEHIDELGRIKDQLSVITELNKGLSDIDLFGNLTNGLSRKPYL